MNQKAKKRFPELEDLRKKERRQRKQEIVENGAEETFAPEEYRYFHPELFLDSADISDEVMEKAQKIVRYNEIKLTRFFTGTGRDDPSVILGQAEFEITQNKRSVCDVTLVCNQTEIVYTRCNSWNCYYKMMSERIDEPHHLCEHEAAGLIVLQKYLKEHDRFDETSPSAMGLMDSLLQNNGAWIEGKEDLKGDILEMEPTLVVQENGSLACTFSVGAPKLYKIKNLDDFVKNMQAKNVMKFGKKTELQLGETYLSDSAKNWYSFLVDALNEDGLRRRATIGTYAVREAQDAPDMLPLYGNRLDQFLKIAIGKTVHARRQGLREKYEWTVREKDLRIRLTVSPDFNPKTNTMEGVRITGKAPEMFRGIQSACYLEDGFLNCIPKEEAEKMSLISDASLGGDINLKVGRYHLADFYHKILPELRKIADVEEKEPGKVIPYLPPEPVFTTYLDYESQAVVGHTEVTYGRRTYSLSDHLKDDRRKMLREEFRDVEVEEHVLEKIMEYLPKYDPSLGVFFCQNDEERIFDFLDHGLDELSELSEIRATNRFQRLGLRKHTKINVGISMEGGLLDLDVQAEDMSEEEMLDTIYQYRQKKKYVRLKNGDFLKLQDDDSIDLVVRMMEGMHVPLKELVKGKMHIPSYRALYIDKMLEGQSDLYVDRDRHFRKLVKEFKTVEDSDYEVPAHLKGTIRLYQKDGYRWLRTLDNYGFGGILADEMGLGKTLQVLAVMEAVQNEEKAGTSLVICPASLVYNWLEEAKKFAPSLRTATVAGTASERAARIREAEQYDLLITSYDLLKRDIAEYEGHEFRFEVIDEAQYIKNHNTSAAKSVKLIHAKTRFALTGTPIENRLSELWSIFDYLMPGFLYEYETFRSTIELPIMKNDDEDARDRLKKMIGPFVLRRRKKDVLKDLPDKIEEIRYAGMEPKQRKLYDARVLRMRTDLDKQDENDFRRNKIQVLAELMRIRQICCDPELCYEDYKGGSAKKELCMDLIRSLVDDGHKTLLFSQFTSMLDILAAELTKEGIPYYTITGQTPKEKRVELVNQFNTDETPVFLISLKAGGTGLNLTGADSVIHYDPWWNTAAENQATDRAHRIGQKKVVTVYKLVVKDTIEEKIVDLQERKAHLAEDILTGEAVGNSTFTKEELMQILS